VLTDLKKVRDFSHFSEVKFLAEVSNVNWNEIISLPNVNTDKLFSDIKARLLGAKQNKTSQEYEH